MAWWTRIASGELAGVKQHKTKIEAAMRINFAVNAGGASLAGCGLYKRNPEKFPGEPDVLPETLVKARGRGRRS